MRVVFMGTPDIAAVCLKRIVEDGIPVSAVYTKPDTPKNRGMKLSQSPVKEFALSQNIPVYQPSSFREDQVVEELQALKPDVIAVVAYGKILPQRVLDIPKYGCINIHASVLPQLRGSGPVQWAILNGFEETGVTAMHMAAEMDAGDIIEIRKTPITPEDNTVSLMARLAVIGGGLLSDTLKKLGREELPRIPQDPSLVTFAPMLNKAMSPIDWTKTAWEISCHVRGLDPWPAATAELDGKRFKIFKVAVFEKTSPKEPGTLLALTKTGLEVACGSGTVEIRELQAEGGKRMAAVDYFRGHSIHI